MPFVDIRIAGSATRAQKAAIVADVTKALVVHLGKSESGVQVNITELSTENYGAGSCAGGRFCEWATMSIATR
jgi:4-oxalocrotonate tautomerase